MADLPGAGRDSAGPAPVAGGPPRGGLILLAALGVLLGVLPHAIAWRERGDWSYIADGDELLYRAWSRGAALRGTWRLEDAVHPASGPMMHPWPVFIPAARLGYALGLGMEGLTVFWRGLVGAGIALGLYVALRPAMPGAGPTLWLAAFLACDAGLLFGQVGLREAELTLAILRHRDADLFRSVPKIMAHLRVVTPGLVIPVLLVHYGLVLRARIGGGARRAAWAAASFAALFYVYVYFSTVVVLGAALAFALDRGGRRLYARLLLWGVPLGAPSLLINYLIKAGTPPDWLLRTDKFVPVAHFDIANLLLPLRIIALWLTCGLVIVRSRRELIYLWCCTGAALAWANHQVVTGLMIENFHWLQAMYLTASLIVALIVAPWVAARAGSRRRAAALGLILAAQVALGFWLRGQEATHSAETRRYADLAHQARRDAPALRLPAGAVVAGDPAFVFLTIAARADVYPLSCRAVVYSSRTTDVELDERLVLNLFLLGTTRRDALALVDAPPGNLSQEAGAIRDPAVAARQRDRRRDLIARIWDDPRPLLAKYGVTHVVLPRAAPTAQLDPIARRIGRGETWDLWQVRGSTPPLGGPPTLPPDAAR